MKYLAKILALFLLTSFFSNSSLAKNVHILFIGDSYTYANNMPKMIEDISASDTNTKTTLIIDQVTKKGARLLDHWNDKEALAKIQSRNWDYVIFQEEGSWALSKFSYEGSYRVAPKFKAASASSVKNKLLFVTWPRKDGSPWYRGNTNEFFKNYSYMQNQITLRSTKLANSLGASQMNIGSYWDFVNKKYPDINLYAKDANNPSVAGSYLNALLFYKVFSKSNNIANLNYAPKGLSEENASLLRQIVSG